ncbi:hypothetical protein BMS3Bbin11_01325 [bacterium BMS3Bbin11]|nr:hypothetical protein BMS3Abin11_00642 [bacterium BMS3Abin11]GBE46227.1 hypothetical protein BMS3Bbin11_01325 [bacterium BMS3Bbin11]GMT39840.1 MAG: hypothetical protein IEMM0001_0575 [bacterium]HDH17044.1 glutaredoxin [Gammaproteobacteria bacterium]
MSIKVEVFSSPGCSKCGKAKYVLEDIAKEIGGNRIDWHEVNILDEIDYAIQLGVLSTPSIAIDGVLIFTSLPSEKRLHSELLKRLNDESQE